MKQISTPHPHYFTFQECTNLEVNRVISLLQKERHHLFEKCNLTWACMACPPSLLHRAEADYGRGSPMSFAFGRARRHNSWHQVRHTLYKVKNTPLFLTTSASQGLELRLVITRTADHKTIRAPHLLLSPCEVALPLPSLVTRWKAVVWHTIKPLQEMHLCHLTWFG